MDARERFEHYRSRESAIARELRGAAANLGTAFLTMRERAEQVAARVSAAEDVIATPAVVVTDVEAIVERLHADGPRALTLRESRLLVGLPERVGIENVGRILEERPLLTRHLLNWCFQSWDRYCEFADAKHAALLLARRAMHLGVPFLAGGGRDLVHLLSPTAPDGPHHAAKLVRAPDLRSAYEFLLNRGLRASWSYTGYVLAEWQATRVAAGTQPLDEDYELIEAHDVLSRMLLPALPGGNEASYSGRIETSVRLQARFAAPAIVEGLSRSATVSLSCATSLLDRCMKSDFGDPRVEPLSMGWQHVRHDMHGALERIRQALLKQDLEFFFAHAMDEPERARFWKDYLGRISRTVCIVGRSKAKNLRQQFVMNKDVQMVLDRASAFSRSSDVHAFCLFIANLVVVEFSADANAAYVFDRNEFEKRFMAKLQKHRLEGPADLKDLELAKHRIVHRRNWEHETAAYLAEAGIHPT